MISREVVFQNTVVVGLRLRRRRLTERLSGGKLGHGLGALGNCVLGELTGEHQAHGGLNLAGCDGGLLVVAGQLGSLGRDLLEQVVDERVHNTHGFRTDASVRVDLLQHLIDVDLIRLHGLLRPLLLAILGGGLLHRLARGLFLGLGGSHYD
jgi:hypothetical protein